MAVKAHLDYEDGMLSRPETNERHRRLAPTPRGEGFLEHHLHVLALSSAAGARAWRYVVALPTLSGPLVGFTLLTAHRMRARFGKRPLESSRLEQVFNALCGGGAGSEQ